MEGEVELEGDLGGEGVEEGVTGTNEEGVVVHRKDAVSVVLV